jgi:hypothetical protein
MYGSAYKNLDMLMKLCGEDYLKNVTLVTTKWDTIPADTKAKAEIREQDLLENFWGDMLQLGCKYQRYSNDPESAQAIVKPILRFHPNWLQIQRELGNGKLLGDTTAGQVVSHTVAEVIALYEAKIESYKDSLKEAQGELLKTKLAEKAEEFQQKYEKILAEKEVLEMNQNALVQEAIKEAEKKFGPKTLLKNLTDRIDNHLPGNITTKQLVNAVIVGIVSAAEKNS